MTTPSERFKRLVQIIAENDLEGKSGCGVNDEEIRRCERQLGITLPESYKWFLHEFAWGLFPESIYGLSTQIPPGFQLVRRTEDLRKKGNPRLPFHLVPFSPDGWGNFYCLDTSHMKDGECPVVFWNHDLDEDQQPKRTNATFLDWLEEAIQWKLERDAEESAPLNDGQDRRPLE